MLYGLDASALRETTSSADRPWRRYAGPKAMASAATAAIAASAPAWRCTDVALDGAAVVERAALLDRLLDELLDEARRVRRGAAARRSLRPR